MHKTSRGLEQVRAEFSDLLKDFLLLEKRISSLRDSLRKFVEDTFGEDRQALGVLDEMALATRVAQALVARLEIPSHTPINRKRYFRDSEEAEYMGVSVACLPRWRLERSKKGPPFARVGRMVMYPMADLEDFMRERLVCPWK